MIKAAIIGCGRMGAGHASRWEGQVPAGWLPMSHADVLNSIDDVKLVALCDSNEEALYRSGKQYDIESLYLDYHVLIDQNKPDLITIATRTPQKADIIKFACENGVKGIYVEKPLANNIKDCKELLSLIEKKGIKLGYGVNRRYHAVYRYAKTMLYQGEIGDLLDIVVEHGHSQLMWTHPHLVDLILFFTNSHHLINIQSSIVPDTVHQCSEWLIDSDPVIDNAVFKFNGGVSATITKANGLNIRLGGSKGNLIIHGNGSFIQLNKRKNMSSPYYLDQKIITPSILKSATVVAITELIDSMHQNGESPISRIDIETGLYMLMGCVWSYLNNGRLIQKNHVPERLTITGKYGDLYA